MKKPRGRGAHDGGSSGDDDHEIWQYTAASIEPLKRSVSGPSPIKKGAPRLIGTIDVSMRWAEAPLTKSSK